MKTDTCMTHFPPLPRRTLLVLGAALASESATAATSPPSPAASAPASRWRGKPGEFDWLSGEWRIANRRRLADGRWDETGGEANCFSILGGVVHIEELRILERQFSGMGLRTLDVQSGLWLDCWVNARSGVLGEAGLKGGFEAGVGIFESEEDQSGQRVRHRGQWDLITPRSCRCQHETGAPIAHHAMIETAGFELLAGEPLWARVPTDSSSVHRVK